MMSRSVKATWLGAAFTIAASVSLISPPASLADNPGTLISARNDGALVQQQGSLIDRELETALRNFIARRFYNRIDATGEQREQLSALFSSTMETTRPMREKFRRGLLDLSALMASESASDDDIMKKIDEVRAVKQQIQDQRIQTALAVRKILTPDQRKKIHDRLEDLLTGGARPKRLSMLMMH